MKHTKKLIALALVVVSVLAVTIPAMAYTQTPVSGTRYITSSNGNPVNVRTGPGTGYSLAAVGTFSVGTQVSLQYQATGTDNQTWYKVVNSSNHGGWVRGDFLTTNGSGSGTNTWLYRYGEDVLGPSDSYNSYVKTLQQDLMILGYSLPIYGDDGYFGDETTAAVVLFQQQHGLTADGYVGDQTKAELWDARFE
jgi:uncharacterized protein YraI